MVEHPNAKLIGHGYDAFARGDLEALREFMAHDVVWRESGRVPLAGDHKGPEGVLALLGELRVRSGGTFTIEIVDLLANAERPSRSKKKPPAAATEHSTWRARSSSRSIRARSPRSPSTTPTRTILTSSGRRRRVR